MPNWQKDLDALAGIRDERSQYQARAIAEYWIVDPLTQRVTVLHWVEGLYEEAAFEGEAIVASPLLTELGSESLMAAQVLQAGQ